MTGGEYMHAIQGILAGNFDFLPRGEYLGYHYDIAAVCDIREEQTALFRDNVMDWSYCREVVLLSRVSSAAEARQAVDELQSIALSSVAPSRHHHCTTVVRIMVSDNWQVDSKSAKRVKHYHYSASFRLGFYGWVKAAVMLVDTSSGKIVSNAAGRDKIKYFAPA